MHKRRQPRRGQAQGRGGARVVVGPFVQDAAAAGGGGVAGQGGYRDRRPLSASAQRDRLIATILKDFQRAGLPRPRRKSRRAAAATRRRQAPQQLWQRPMSARARLKQGEAGAQVRAAATASSTVVASTQGQHIDEDGDVVVIPEDTSWEVEEEAPHGVYPAAAAAGHNGDAPQPPPATGFEAALRLDLHDVNPSSAQPFGASSGRGPGRVTIRPSSAHVDARTARYALADRRRRHSAAAAGSLTEAGSGHTGQRHHTHRQRPQSARPHQRASAVSNGAARVLRVTPEAHLYASTTPQPAPSPITKTVPVDPKDIHSYLLPSDPRIEFSPPPAEPVTVASDARLRRLVNKTSQRTTLTKALGGKRELRRHFQAIQREMLRFRAPDVRDGVPTPRPRTRNERHGHHEATYYGASSAYSSPTRPNGHGSPGQAGRVRSRGAAGRVRQSRDSLAEPSPWLQDGADLPSPSMDLRGGRSFDGDATTMMPTAVAGALPGGDGTMDGAASDDVHVAIVHHTATNGQPSQRRPHRQRGTRPASAPTRRQPHGMVPHYIDASPTAATPEPTPASTASTAAAASASSTSRRTVYHHRTHSRSFRRRKPSWQRSNKAATPRSMQRRTVRRPASARVRRPARPHSEFAADQAFPARPLPTHVVLHMRKAGKPTSSVSSHSSRRSTIRSSR